MLVDDLSPEGAAEIDSLPGSDQRVCKRVGLGAAQTLEIDRHAERRQLVVRYLALRVPEHQLGELVRRELASVALPLDQLGDMDHAAAFSATSTQLSLVAHRGQPPSGSRSANSRRVSVAETYRWASSRLAIVTAPATSWRRT